MAEILELRFNNPLDDAESLKLSLDGNIIDIGQKEKKLSNIQGQYVGFFKISENKVKLYKKIKNYRKVILPEI